MYITIGEHSYTSLSDLSFAPETDITGAKLPINQYQAEINTPDSIAMGQYARLYDDLDALWAKYWITYAERVNPSTVRVIAQSEIAVLDRVELEAAYYDGAPLDDVLDAVMVRKTDAEGIVARLDYTLDDSFDGLTITGYCPKQSARERLQAVLLVIGGIIRDWATETLLIVPIDTTATTIPLGDTYERPSVSYRDHVTELYARRYEFTETAEEPAATDEWVETEDKTYIYSWLDIGLENTDLPEGAPDNPVRYEQPMLINDDNVDTLLARLAPYHFGRTDIDASVINNGTYWPGDRVRLYVGRRTIMSGYIQRVTFAFGLQAKGRLSITAAESVAARVLTIKRMYGGIKWGESTYTLPVGYAYSITSPYMDITYEGHRRILRPLTATVTGTMPDEDVTVTVEYAEALDQDLDYGILSIISVDGVTLETETEDDQTINVAVIE